MDFVCDASLCAFCFLKNLLLLRPGRYLTIGLPFVLELRAQEIA